MAYSVSRPGTAPPCTIRYVTREGWDSAWQGKFHGVRKQVGTWSVAFARWINGLSHALLMSPIILTHISFTYV
jgi:hypothetical protein